MSEGLAIMTSGGDAAGMNPAIKCTTDYSKLKGLTPYLVRGGLSGLIDDDIKEATAEDVSGILYRGGTVLHSCRSKRFFEYDYRKQAYENLKKRGITKMVVIGGDGSFSAMNRFHGEFKIPFSGIPATIDNDIAGTDYCLGVDTALNMIRQSVDSIRDTAQSFKRAFVIETMGRDCGYLAMMSALSSGAEICIVPEMPVNLDSVGKRLKKQMVEGRNYILAIVAEGTGMSQKLTSWMEEELGLDARLTILGHVQRGGSPTVHDRVMAYKFSIAAVDVLLKGGTNQIMTYKKGSFDSVKVESVVDRKSKMDEEMFHFIKHLSI